MTATPEQLAELKRVADTMGIDLEEVADGYASALEFGGPNDLMALLAADHQVDDVAVDGSFEELAANLDPRWGRLMQWVGQHLATRIPGQGEAIPAMLLQWALGMFTAELARDPEGLRTDVLQLVRRCCAELEISADQVYAADGAVLPTEEHPDATD